MNLHPYRSHYLFFIGLFLLYICQVKGQVLKSIVYDFDGFDLNQTSLPEGEYSYGDLTYQITANPLTASDMLGDRVLKLNVNWNNGYAAFGRGISRYIEFDPNLDVFNFYFYNPTANNQNATLEVAIADDDNQSNAYESASDDSWRKNIVITASEGWQLISIPLKDFTDYNAGGNGVFDMTFTQNKGMLLLVEFRFNRLTPGLPNAVFYIDMINFTEGNLPVGATNLDLPNREAGDHCFLGAFKNESNGAHELIPGHIESLFPTAPGRKLKYVNTFLAFANGSSTVASLLPGSSIQTLINNGYIPIITWEPFYLGYAPLDPIQPKLDNIINGDFDTYIDLFADKIKTYSDTIIIRLMHEFEGDWYPWCISQNNQDPAKFVSAYRKIVDRFTAKGVTNVQWMWCGNSDYAPYKHYNWLVNAYPGDNYVDIVATDVYNNIYPTNLPWWRSFRWQTTECYYYLTKYFPSKPIIICELACRERTSGELTSSETKSEWWARMDKELQSNFHKIRGAIFFNAVVSQDWNINTSPASITSLKDNLWLDDYYFFTNPGPTSIKEKEISPTKGLSVYPNPSLGVFTLNYSGTLQKGNFSIKIINALGTVVNTDILKEAEVNFPKQIDLGNLPRGIYFVEVRSAGNFSGKLTIKETEKIVLK